MYRAHGNPVYDFLQARGRLNKGTGSGVVYERRDVRGTMKALKKGRALWYGPDQDYGLSQGLFVPFFGIQAATVYATARFAEKTGAAVVPFSHIRLPGSQGYKITVYPALEDFPVGDDLVGYHAESTGSLKSLFCCSQSSICGCIDGLKTAPKASRFV